MDSVRSYIDLQRQHHAKLSFQEEFVAFLTRHRVVYDAQYVWD
ncbi:MAG TPA: hypothetical protein PLD59_10845 [Tepidisphaeraceae bacterium]|nr:hypothetical protein [Tepidisphaeraceae bacterium]